jgi:hypothetical protein
MTIFYLIAIAFGVSGWLFSWYLWNRYLRLSAPKPEKPPENLDLQQKGVITDPISPVQKPRTSRDSTVAGSKSDATPPIQKSPKPLPALPVPYQSPDLLHRKEDKDAEDKSIYIEAGDGTKILRMFGHPKYVLACLVLLVLAATVVWGGMTLLTKDKKGTEGGFKIDGDISFIKIVNTENNLIVPPDWKTTTIKTVDSKGNEIEVVLGVLWDPYRWVKASTRYVALDLDEKDKYPIEDIIKTFHNDEKRPIIVVGTASHENAKENPEEEIARAADRADKLVTICGQHFINRPHIFSLNLGAYKPDRNPSIYSASERRVILLVIEKGENSPDLTAEIKKILEKAKKEQNFIFDARDYSLFDSDRFQVVRRMNF